MCEGNAFLCKVGFVAVCIVVTFGARAATFASEYALLKSLPASAAAFMLERGEPDAQGYVGFHRRDGKWYEAGMQRGGCRMVIAAVVDGDEARADAAWRAVEVTFAQQLEDGGFVSNPQPGESFAPAKVERIETACFFLQECARAILVIKASPMAGHFEARLKELEPKLRRAADFIQQGVEPLIWKVGHTANRLLITGKAYGLCGLVLNDDPLKASCARLVAEALKRRDAEGVFIERGGRDSSYCAVSLLMGQQILLYLPNAELEAAMTQTMAWVRTRVMDTGEVMVEGNTRTGVGREASPVSGKTKEVNYREVAQALCYFGVMRGDAEAVALAEKVAGFRK